ncbi:MAG: hypothetical protein EOP50_13915, partial [Sphingobacteriales bacterium]
MVLVWRKVRAYSNEIDGQLLLFLVLLCNVKLVVKAAALLLLLWRHRALGTALLRKAPRVTLFYPAIALLGLLGAV